jgi:hypothetical protein
MKRPVYCGARLIQATMSTNAHYCIFTKTWSRTAVRAATSTFQTTTCSSSFYSDLNMMRRIKLVCEIIHPNYFFCWRILLANHRRPYSWTVLCTHLTAVAFPSLSQSGWLREPRRTAVFHILCHILYENSKQFHLHCQFRAIDRSTAYIYFYNGPRNTTGTALRYTASGVI